MNLETAVQAAIDSGAQHGIASLNDWQQTIFLISEAELLADMGAEFCTLYPANAFAAAFQRIGASHIANLFTHLAAHPHDNENEQALAAAISRREGYSYSNIAAYVAAAQKAT